MIILITAFSLGSFAQETLDWQLDIKQAVDISIKEKKPLFLFFTGSDWCGVCKKLQNEVFAYPQFKEWADKNVVLVELDFPRNKEPDPRYKDQNQTMKNIFGVNSYPTIVFVTPTKRQEDIYYSRIGSIGYKQGGPDAWLKAAGQIIPTQN